MDLVMALWEEHRPQQVASADLGSQDNVKAWLTSMEEASENKCTPHSYLHDTGRET
jgi:hypothetical protein